MITKLNGYLEIHHERGVIYFHTSRPSEAGRFNTITILRICSLPKPIPKDHSIDLTHMHGVSFTPGKD